MADRAKYRYRGQTHTRPSQRPGKKRVKVKGHCRGRPTGIAARVSASYQKAKEWGF